MIQLLGILLAVNIWAKEPRILPTDPDKPIATATFAGGCFWSMEAPFEKLKGVTEAVVGYSGGDQADPSYEDVSAGDTGHVESVRVFFDPSVIKYEELLQTYWRQINPTDKEGQFVDRGDQYRPVIFYENEEQKKAAEASKAAFIKSRKFGKKPITLEILPFKAFYRAEEYHQNYYKRSDSADKYKAYRKGCGRDEYLDKIWGKNRPH